MSNPSTLAPNAALAAAMTRFVRNPVALCRINIFRELVKAKLFVFAQTNYSSLLALNESAIIPAFTAYQLAAGDNYNLAEINQLEFSDLYKLSLLLSADGIVIDPGAENACVISMLELGKVARRQAVLAQAHEQSSYHICRAPKLRKATREDEKGI
jgi:hypothetical protein